MRIGNFQILPDCGDFDTEIFNFLHHQEPVEFACSPPRGVFRPVVIPASSPSSLDDYQFRPRMPSKPHSETDRQKSNTQKKSHKGQENEAPKKVRHERRARKLEVRLAEKRLSDFENKARGDNGDKIQEKLRLEKVSEIKALKSRMEYEVADSVLSVMCCKDQSEYSCLPLREKMSEVIPPTVDIVFSLSDSSTSLLPAPTASSPKHKSSFMTILMARLRKVARRTMYRILPKY